MALLRLLVYVLLLLAPLAGCARGNAVKSNSPAQVQVDALAAKLANRDIRRVEILQIPARVLTGARVTPEMLEEGFYYKIAISDIRGDAYENSLVEAAKSMAVQPGTETADLRWGVIFYGVDDGRVGALYFDKTGSSGAVGDAPVSFRGDFFNWLDDNFSHCLH